MDRNTTDKLIKLNKQFYQTFASQFSATRERLQPGVMRVLEIIPPKSNILDLGCGNGEFARQLALNDHQGQYLGLDFSQGLLDVARAGCSEQPNFSFAQADLSSSDWHTSISIPHTTFNIVVAFATLHHLPGRELHLQTITKIRDLLSPDGIFIHSNWQFLNSSRLKARIQPWDVIGLSSAQVDRGDYLLDWRRGGYGLRYVHQFSETELLSLAQETGFKVEDSFLSDGQEGNLGLYQVWKQK